VPLKSVHGDVNSSLREGEKCPPWRRFRVWVEIEQLRRATVRQLQAKYLELFGQPSHSNHKQFLFRRIAWRLQALAYGDLAEHARERALAIAQDADLRIKAPRHLVGTSQQVLQPTFRSRRKPGRDERLPAPGTILRREFQDEAIVVQVLEHGFQYQDRFYKSLSAIARQVTGTHWNGYAFFATALRTSNGEDH
jgi:Protein of unknown function (DUF2924)